MQEQTIALQNTIFKVMSGSHLYGTNTEDSDKDYLGVFIPTEDYVVGIKRVEQVEWKTNKSDSNKGNTKEDVDCTLYALPKFIHLITQNNPTVLELLFAPDKCIVQDTEFGKRLRAAYPMFISKKCKWTFLGYAYSQKQKVLNKRDRYSQFIEVLDKVNDLEKQGYTELPERLSLNTDLIEAGTWRCYEKGQPIPDVKARIQKEIGEYGHRIESIKKIGYDGKFMSHVLRLLSEGLQALVEGRIELPLPDNNLIRDIKLGKYTLEEVLKLCEEKEKYIEEAYIRSTLQNSPDVNKINELQKNLMLEFWGYKK